MLWPPAETRPTFGRYKPAGQDPLISGRLELVGLKKVETHAKLMSLDFSLISKEAADKCLEELYRDITEENVDKVVDTILKKCKTR